MANDFGREGDPLNKPDKRSLRDTAKRLKDGSGTKPLSSRSVLDWRLDQRTVCTPGGSDADIYDIAGLADTLKKSRTGAALFETLAPANLEIVYDHQSPASQLYPRDGRMVVTLNPYRPRGDLLNLMSREIRRAWQHQQGALVNPLNFEPDEAILVNRAQTADALMIAVKIAWELRLAGETEAWDWFSGSPMADVSRTFELKVREDFRTLNNGAAPRAAYDKFFEDSRTKIHDKRIIHQMLLDEHTYIRSSAKRPRVSMDLFQRLGELPHGRNYLAMRTGKSPVDMCYSTVEDRSNANFLWFIKFERSFQEKEMQMIQEAVRMTAEVVDMSKWVEKREPRKAPAPSDRPQ